MVDSQAVAFSGEGWRVGEMTREGLVCWLRLIIIYQYYPILSLFLIVNCCRLYSNRFVLRFTDLEDLLWFGVLGDEWTLVFFFVFSGHLELWNISILINKRGVLENPFESGTFPSHVR